MSDGIQHWCLVAQENAAILASFFLFVAYFKASIRSAIMFQLTLSTDAHCTPSYSFLITSSVSLVLFPALLFCPNWVISGHQTTIMTQAKMPYFGAFRTQVHKHTPWDHTKSKTALKTWIPNPALSVTCWLI